MFVINREKLLPLLQMVIGVVERRHTFISLSHVLVSIKQKKITLVATDLEVQLSASAELEDDIPDCQFTLPARLLFDVCKNLPQETDIGFSLEANQVRLTYHRSHCKLSKLSSENFYLLDNDEWYFETKITQSKLFFLLNYTYFAIAQQDIRYFLNGLLLEFQNQKIVSVASDGHRMALVWQENSMSVEKKEQIILPRKGVAELLKVLVNFDPEDFITIKLGKNHVQFSTSKMVLTSKLIDSKFPDYRRFLPNHLDKVATIDKDNLREVLLRVAVLSDKNKIVKVVFSEGELIITSSNNEHEEAQEKITIDYQQQELTLGLNVNYLLDVINVIKGDKISFKMNDNVSGILIEEVDNEWVSFIIMPIKL